MPSGSHTYIILSTILAISNGLSEFQTLSQSPYYVDKTYFLSTLFSELKIPFNFITCPRHFGKTSMLVMIESFAQIEIDKHRHPIDWTSSKAFQIFQNLSAAQIQPLMRNHLAHYPVIQLNLGFPSVKDFNGTNLLDSLNQKLEKCFDKFRWLCKCRHNRNFSAPYGPYGNISQEEYVFVKSALNRTLDNTGISNSLLELCKILYNYFRSTQVIVLVDDYDSASINAMLAPSVNLNEYYELVNTILSKISLEGQEYIKFCLITATSAINFYKDQATRFATVTHRPFLSYHQFIPFCGFVDSEIKATCHKYHIGQKKQSEIQRYYNGYFTCGSDPKLVYNSFAFTRYLMFGQELKKYSKHTPQYKIIERLLMFKVFRQNLFRSAWSKSTDTCNFFLKKNYETDDLEKMLSLLGKDHNYLTCEQISQDREAYLRILHSFAFEQGYFTYCIGQKHHFKIANYQVKLEIKDMMTKYFKAPPDREF